MKIKFHFEVIKMNWKGDTALVLAGLVGKKLQYRIISKYQN